MVRRRVSCKKTHQQQQQQQQYHVTVTATTPLILQRSRTTLLSLLLMMLMSMTMMVQDVTCFRCTSTPVLARGGQRRCTSSFIAPMVLLQKASCGTVARTTSSTSSSSSSLSMFMGSDGGLLGIGTPEVFTILLVGYFILGPSDLYKLVKEIGKFIQNIRTMGTDLTTSFENNMESQLQLEELRKAQRELNDAFSFRRSINTNYNEPEAFTTTVDTPREPSVLDASMAATAIATATTAGGPKKMRRKKRVIIKKKQQSETNLENLEMPETGTTPVTTTTTVAAATTTKNDNRPRDPFIQDSNSYTKEEEDAINADFDKYTLGTGSDDNDDLTYNKYNSYGLPPPPVQQEQQSRFQQQLSGTWNEKVLSNEDSLAPVGQIMQLLAVLEEEKIAATKRLEEEFRKRAELDEAYYQKQRKLLKDAASTIQIQQQQQEQQTKEAQKTE